MNKKQALKAATERIDWLEDENGNLEYFNKRAAGDIKAYNKVIDGMIAGESPCPWCEDFATGECKNPEKGGKGCKDWMLMWEHGEEGEYNGKKNGDGKGILEAGTASGEGPENIAGAIETL